MNFYTDGPVSKAPSLLLSLWATLLAAAPAAAGSITLSYSQPVEAVQAGALIISADFSEPPLAPPAISIDRPGTGNDLAPTVMSAVTTTRFEFSYNVLVANGTDILDGQAVVTIDAVETSTNLAFPQPSPNSFTTDTSGGGTATGPTTPSTVTVDLSAGFENVSSGPLTITATFQSAPQGTPRIFIDRPGEGNDVLGLDMTRVAAGDPLRYQFTYGVLNADGVDVFDGTAVLGIDAADTNGRPFELPPRRAFDIKTAGGPMVLFYSQPFDDVRAGPLRVTATFASILAGPPTITIDRPGSGNDVSGLPMAAEGPGTFVFDYEVALADGSTILDGFTPLDILATADGLNRVPLPPNNFFLANSRGLDPRTGGSDPGAAGPSAFFSYSDPASPVGTGPLTITAFFSEPPQASPAPSLDIDRPGSGNDVSMGTMQRVTDGEWTFVYNVLPADGVTLFDGETQVFLAALDSLGNPFPNAANNVFFVGTAEGGSPGSPSSFVSLVYDRDARSVGPGLLEIIANLDPAPTIPPRISIDRPGGGNDVLGAAMTEVRPGSYTFTYTVLEQNGSDIFDGPVTVTLQADHPRGETYPPAGNDTFFVATGGAGGVSPVTLFYDRDPQSVPAGPLTILAQFDAPPLGDVFIDIDRPGTGNDVIRARMTAQEGNQFSFVHGIQPHDGVSTFDGETIVRITASDQAGNPFPQPFENVFFVNTGGFVDPAAAGGVQAMSFEFLPGGEGVPAGPLEIRAVFSEPPASRVELFVDRPGTGNDLFGELMTAVTDNVYTFTYQVLPANGLDVRDGPAQVHVRATAASGAEFPQPPNGVISFSTAGIGGAAGGLFAGLSYDQEPGQVRPGALRISARFSEPPSLPVRISIDRPGTGNDVDFAEMSLISPTEFLYTYSIRPGDGTTVLDGPTQVRIQAFTAGGDLFPRPENDVFSIVTAGEGGRFVELGYPGADEGQIGAGPLTIVAHFSTPPAGSVLLSLDRPGEGGDLADQPMQRSDDHTYVTTYVVPEQDGAAIRDGLSFLSVSARDSGGASFPPAANSILNIVTEQGRSEAGLFVIPGDAGHVVAGPLRLEVVLTRDVAGDVLLSIDRPGTGNDVLDAVMTQVDPRRFAFVYQVAPSNGQDILDGPTELRISGLDTAGSPLKTPVNSGMIIETGAGSDLAVGFLELIPGVPSTGDIIQARIGITNRGRGDAPPVPVEIRVDGFPVRRSPAGPFEPGGSVDLLPVDFGPLERGSHTFSVIVDPEQDLADMDRSNNRVDEVLAVSTISGEESSFLHVVGHVEFESGDRIPADVRLTIQNEGNGVAREFDPDGGGDFSGVFSSEGAARGVRSGDRLTVRAFRTSGTSLSIVRPEGGALLLTDLDIERGFARLDVLLGGAGEHQDELGVLRTVAGSGARGFAGDGGRAQQASLSAPGAVIVTPGGDLVVVDRGNHRVRIVRGDTRVITTLAGNGLARFAGDGGPAELASLNLPGGVALGLQGDLYIADTANHRVRRIDGSTRIITTVAGTGVSGSTAAVIDTQSGGAATAETSSSVQSGLLSTGVQAVATGSQLSLPQELLALPSGVILISDSGNHRILSFDPQAGTLSLVAGNGQAGNSGDGGLATGARLKEPRGMALGPGGNLYFADAGAHVVRRVDADTGVIETLAGSGTQGYGGDGGPARAALLNRPTAVAVDPVEGSFLVADTGNHVFRTFVAEDSSIQTESGDGTPGFAADGTPLSRARLNRPTGLFLVQQNTPGGSSSGGAPRGLAFSDQGNHLVRFIDLLDENAADDHADSASATTTADTLATDGSFLRAELQEPGDVDVFRFEAEAGVEYTLDVELITLADSVMTLLGRDGRTVIARNDDAEEDPFDPGTRLTNTDGAPLAGAQSQTLESPQVSNQPGSDPASSGGLLDSFAGPSDGSGLGLRGSRLQGITFDEAGTYFVQVEGFSPDLVGAYRIAVATQTFRSDTILMDTDVGGLVLGKPFAHNLRLRGGTGTLSMNVIAGDLPPGLDVSSSGVMGGTPEAFGVFNIIVEVADEAGLTGRFPVSMEVLPSEGGARFPESPHPYPHDLVDVQTFTLPGSPSAIRVSFDPRTEVESGFDTIVILDGTGTEIPESPFTGNQLSGRSVLVPGNSVSIKLLSDGSVARYGYRVVGVIPAGSSEETLDVDFQRLPTATSGEPYSVSLEPPDAEPPLTFQIVSGSLPAGLSLDPNSGEISGTTTHSGTYSFGIRVRDGGGEVGTGVFELAVYRVGGRIFPESPHPYPNSDEDIQNYTVQAEGGLPDGILVTFHPATRLQPGFDFLHVTSATGEPIPGSPFTGDQLSGRTVHVPGATVVLRLESDGAVSDFGYRIVDVVPVPDDIPTLQFTGSPELPSALEGAPYEVPLPIEGGIHPYRFQVTGGRLPPGVFLDPSQGVLRGRAGEKGAFSATVSVTDGSTPVAQTASRTFALTVNEGRRGTVVRMQVDEGPTSVTARLNLSGLTEALDLIFLELSYDPLLLSFESYELGDAAAGGEALVDDSAPGLLSINLTGTPSIIENGELLRLNFNRGATSSLAGGSALLADLRSAGRFERIEAGTLPAGALSLVQTSLGGGSNEFFVAAPVADAGADRYIRIARDGDGNVLPTIPDPASPGRENRRNFVRLDGRRSFDLSVPPLPLLYRWSQTEGPTATLSDAGGPLPSFVPPARGRYGFRLVVENGQVASPPSDVFVFVDEQGCSPRAEALLRDRGTGQSSAPFEAPLVVQAGQASVTLDGTLSTDPNPSFRQSLTFDWTQVLGPSVALQPSSTSPAPVVAPTRAGTYAFRLVVTNRDGCSSEPLVVRFLARDSADTPPVLSVVSSSTSTSTLGDDLGEAGSLRLVRSLRTTLPATVSLRASVLDPDVGVAPLKQRLSYFWSQLSGPAVRLSTPTVLDTEALVSTVTFRPTTVGVHVFRCLVRELDSTGNALGVDVDRTIRVLVEARDRRLPEAAFQVSQQGRVLKRFPLSYASGNQAAEVNAAETVTLDGSSSSTQGQTLSLSYTWTQISGPSVSLSDPFSPVTTFQAPDFGDGQDRTYAFQLFVDDGQASSEPVAGSVRVLARTTRTAQVPLVRGLNLVSIPIDPSTTRAYTAADLLASTGASFVARVTSSQGESLTFEAYVPGTGRAPFVIEANQAYILGRKGAAGTITLSGADWPSSGRTRALGRGLNLVGYPGREAPSDLDAESLRSMAGSEFVTRIGSSGRFEAYLQGESLPFGIEPGKGYLLGVKSRKTVSLPAP